MKIESKLPNTKTSIFAVMTGLANEHGAINLSQGFPNFPISQELISLVNKNMLNGNNQYAPMPGILPLREAISEKLKDTYGHSYNPQTEITITPGATHGLSMIITSFIRPNDEVIIFEPAYDSYLPNVELCGGVVRPINLVAPTYHINWTEVENTINPKTRMIIINTPHNPTGTVLGEKDMKELIRLTKDTNIIIISDEVYEHLIFDNIRHESILYYPELIERSFVVASFGKTFHTTGWKMGYVASPKTLMDEYRKVHQFSVFTCNTPMQWAFAEYLKNKENYLSLGKFYQEKRDFMTKALEGSRFKVLDCKGTYFMLLDYSQISSDSEMDFAVRLTKECKVATVPVSPFYSNEVDNKTLRICFAKTDETLLEAANILKRI